jgi:hypothetical protein
MLSVVILNIVMLSVIMLNIMMLNVVAPFKNFLRLSCDLLGLEMPYYYRDGNFLNYHFNVNFDH